MAAFAGSWRTALVHSTSDGGRLNRWSGGWRAAPIVTVIVCLAWLGGCGRLDLEQGNDVATKLQTDGSWRQVYHRLAMQEPDAVPLRAPAFLVAIEKAPRALTRQHQRAPDTPEFRRTETWNDERKKRFDEVMSDGTAMFVSHIRAFPAAPAVPVDLYNVYRHDTACAEPLNGNATGTTELGCYAMGWRALQERLQPALLEALDAAADAGAPITHLIFASTGWGNDQVEAIGYFNDWVRETAAAADTPFRPLLVGITWPSVWGRQDDEPLSAMFLKIGSYFNKADDADEVGFTVFNWLVNRLAADLKQRHAETRVVAIGHSFGARIASRAVFSAELFADPAINGASTSPVDLMIGLQPAVNVSRFIDGTISEGEHFAEFRDHLRTGTTVLMTTSSEDNALVLAIWSRHIGGHRGRARAANYPDHYTMIGPVDKTGSFECTESLDRAARERVLLVDASASIIDHGDVFDKEAGQLIWSAITCFAPTADQFR